MVFCHRSASTKRFDDCPSSLFLLVDVAPGGCMPTMADVAKRAGVSLSTVSYALNGTRPISEETRQRIMAAMDELGYRPHALARGLASKRSRIIALLFPTPERGMGMTELEFVTSAADAATEHGYNLVLWPTLLHDAVELQQLIQQGLVDGVVVMEVHLNDVRVNFLRDARFPFSIIGRCADTTDITYVDIDFEQTINDTVRYLAGLGHRRIAFLNHSREEYEAGYGPAVRAHATFLEATAEAEIAGVAQFCHAAPADGYETFTHLSTVYPDLTALIAMNDRTIPGVIQAVADRGWSIPDDISLVSVVSSARLAEMTAPPLTTMEPPTKDIGRLGVELLIRQLEQHEQDVFQQRLPCELVVRGSAGPVRISVTAIT